MGILVAPNKRAKGNGNDSVTGEVTAKTYSSNITAVLVAALYAGDDVKLTRYTVVDAENFYFSPTLTLAGCTNAANNGTFKLQKIDTVNNYLYAYNIAGVTETSPAEALATQVEEIIGLHVKSIEAPDAITLIDATNVGTATTYYPSSAGLSVLDYKDVSFEGTISGGVTVTIEATNDDDWKDITKAGYDKLTDATGNTSFIDTSFMLDFDNLQSQKIRIKSITSDATNAVKYVARVK